MFVYLRSLCLRSVRTNSLCVLVEVQELNEAGIQLWRAQASCSRVLGGSFAQVAIEGEKTVTAQSNAAFKP